MEMNYNSKNHMVCISPAEYESVYREQRGFDLIKEIIKSGVTLEELKDNEKKQEIVNGLGVPKDKESIEFFVAFFLLAKFYESNSEVCFYLKDSVKARDIESFDDFKLDIKENSIDDFGILSGETMEKRRLRKFQLKQYRGVPKTKNLFDFFVKVLKKYGYDMGTTNILVVLQGDNTAFQEMDIDFKYISEELQKLTLKGDFSILLMYNDNNKEHKMITLYPSLGSSTISL